jgi:hypothetical protein
MKSILSKSANSSSDTTKKIHGHRRVMFMKVTSSRDNESNCNSRHRSNNQRNIECTQAKKKRASIILSPHSKTGSGSSTGSRRSRGLLQRAMNSANGGRGGSSITGSSGGHGSAVTTAASATVFTAITPSPLPLMRAPPFASSSSVKLSTSGSGCSGGGSCSLLFLQAPAERRSCKNGFNSINSRINTRVDITNQLAINSHRRSRRSPRIAAVSM